MQELTSARVLKRSLAWNALGTLLPVLAAVVAVPPLIDGLGAERFGLLTLVWALVGYASLFDLGLGRALTVVVAERLGRANAASDDKLGPLLWTGLWRLVALRPGLLRPSRPRQVPSRQLLGQGGWMTVSNVVGPLMTYLDRFIVGAILGTAAVALYATPYEVLGRLNVLPGIVLGVLFPAMATAFASEPARARRLYADAATVLRHGLWVGCLMLVLFAEELLAAWIDPAFARQAAPGAWWLGVGVWIKALAPTPFTLLQGVGRSDLIATVHLAELAPYLALVARWTIGRLMVRLEVERKGHSRFAQRLELLARFGDQLVVVGSGGGGLRQARRDHR
jgi:O-antigen/teichoic acid export membrane protein